jgi:hypothetical protein
VKTLLADHLEYSVAVAPQLNQFPVPAKAELKEELMLEEMVVAKLLLAQLLLSWKEEEMQYAVVALPMQVEWGSILD